MLSILIPTKNYDCHLLVEELHKQGEKLGLPYEVILGEDGTSKNELHTNSCIDSLPHCRRIILDKSIGRAAIRNRLADEALYGNLIFIDSDAIAEKSDFLELYATSLKEYEVVCGGLYHANKMPDTSCSLRYKYEKKADKKRNAEVRNKAPFDKFSTFNFAIRKELFQSIRFNEGITRYGHEDTLFGKELEKLGAKLIHIDNKLLHNGLESNDIYLNKVEQSISTLIDIKEIIGTTPLLKAAEKLNRMHLTWLFATLWKWFHKAMRKNLTSSNPSLMVLALYKLAYYCHLDR
ncbi:MAG: glycosyltransferase [Bacteroidaceae bacterium]|nr:glycosyltransferase [Bacteroidaceae bacterium]